MKKLIYIAILTLAVLVSYRIGKYTNTVDKYSYLNLEAISKTEIDGEKITIHTFEGDSYIVHGIRR